MRRREDGGQAGREDVAAPAKERLDAALESLLHLLPTAASLHDGEGRQTCGAQATPLCRVLAASGEQCREDAQALARSALDRTGAAHSTCRAGLELSARALCHGGRPHAVLLAAVSAPPDDPDHWRRVARERGLDEKLVLDARRRSASLPLSTLDAEERLDVAASVMTRLLAGPEKTDATPEPASGEEESRRRHALAVLHQLALSARTLEVEQILEAVFDAFEDVLGTRRAAIFFHDAASGTATAVASRGGSRPGRVRALRTPLAAFPAAVRAAAEGRALHVPAGEGMPREHVEPFGVKDLVLVPLLAHGELLGFVAADHGGEDFEISEEALKLATTIAGPAALALDQARLRGALDVARRSLEAIAEIADAALGPREDAGAAIARAARAVPGIDLCASLRLGEEGWELEWSDPPAGLGVPDASDALLAVDSDELHLQPLDLHPGSELASRLRSEGHVAALALRLGSGERLLLASRQQDAAAPIPPEALGALRACAALFLRSTSVAEGTGRDGGST